MKNVQDGWQLTALTAQEVFAIWAALEVLYDEEEEHYPGVDAARAKVLALRSEVEHGGFVAENHPSLPPRDSWRQPIDRLLSASKNMPQC